MRIDFSSNVIEVIEIFNNQRLFDFGNGFNIVLWYLVSVIFVFLLKK